MTNKICKMCGSDNTNTFLDIPSQEWITECENCGYWEYEYDYEYDAS